MRRLIRSLAVLAFVAAIGAAPKAEASFLPVGPQNDVLTSTVTGTWGWTQCYHDLYNNFSNSLSSILGGCSGNYLMLAAKHTGDADFDVLAAAAFGDVTFATPGSGGTTVSHTGNGSQWYFNTSWSWGFAGLTDTVSLNS